MNPQAGTSASAIVGFYRTAPFRTRAFLWLRWSLTPYEKLATEFPTDGTILDLGCGHGLLSLALCLGSSSRRVVSIDHDAARIQLARLAAGLAGTADRTTFIESSVTALPALHPRQFDSIALIDVLHYFTPPDQQIIIKTALGLLSPRGVLVIREVDPGKGALSRWTALYERIATLTGFTQTSSTGLHFRNSSEWIRMLEGFGFRARTEPFGSSFFSDRLYIARRS
ncbi:MAG: class I SAM-dependent methyltransferase [Gemmatimonadaceae bacterium]